MLLVTGTLLFIADRFRPGNRREAGLTVTDAVLTGIAQGMAIIPGISRSGSTIATLLLRGVSGETAARFSFLLSLPAVGGAALLSLRDASHLAPGELPVYLAGAGAALLVGLLRHPPAARRIAPAAAGLVRRLLLAGRRRRHGAVARITL